MRYTGSENEILVYAWKGVCLNSLIRMSAKASLPILDFDPMAMRYGLWLGVDMVGWGIFVYFFKKGFF